jgi:hypothetical protein
LKTTLLLMVVLAASATSWRNAAAFEPNPDGAFDFRALQLKILNPETNQMIGSTRFMVSHDGSTEEVKGASTYLNGERDDESERLYVAGPGSAPRLETYEHSFFNADGSLHMVDTLDAKSGAASCTTYASGNRKVHKSQLNVPADSFAGASELMMVVASLRHGMHQINFHAFACVPWPELFSVEASVPAQSEHWQLYPGSLIRLDMRPDLGALNFVMAPFMPTMDAWFDPDDNWNYVGGEFDRYFRGPHVLTVRASPASN